MDTVESHDNRQSRHSRFAPGIHVFELLVEGSSFNLDCLASPGILSIPDLEKISSKYQSDHSILADIAGHRRFIIHLFRFPYLLAQLIGAAFSYWRILVLGRVVHHQHLFYQAIERWNFDKSRRKLIKQKVRTSLIWNPDFLLISRSAISSLRV